MKRSRSVRLTLVATASSAAVGGAVACRRPAQEALHCVERGTNRVVPDSLCGPPQRLAADSGGTGSFGNTAARPGYGGYYGGLHLSPFLWYYGGRVSSGYANAGAYSPLANTYYRSSGGYRTSGVLRRGFFGGSGNGASDGGHAGGSASRGAVSRGGFGGIGAGHGASHGS